VIKRCNHFEKRASLLRYDSIHGDFEGQLLPMQNNALIINGTTVHIITANSIWKLIIPWNRQGFSN
jgi:glyceraldehyde-3-phosphate dehydrogenase/erythrose-4-phosphate dehydrogenase